MNRMSPERIAGQGLERLSRARAAGNNPGMGNHHGKRREKTDGAITVAARRGMIAQKGRYAHNYPARGRKLNIAEAGLAAIRSLGN